MQRAGGFEPGRGPQTDEVRIVRDIHPPRIALDYRLLADDDDDGGVLRESARILSDAAFPVRPNLHARATTQCAMRKD